MTTDVTTVGSLAIPPQRSRHAHDLLSIPEVIAELGVPRSTFYRWRQTGVGPKATVAVFGGRRRTASITARLDAARQRALADGRLVAHGDLITAAATPVSATAATSASSGPSAVVADGTADPMAAAVIASPAFRRQRGLGTRTAITDEAVARLLSELVANPARRLSTTAAGAALGVPVYQARGALSQVQQLMNIEGYAVLTLDSDGDTVVLDEGMLREQFELGRSAPETAEPRPAGDRTDYERWQADIARRP